MKDEEIIWGILGEGYEIYGEGREKARVMREALKLKEEEFIIELETLLSLKATPTKHTEHHIRYKRLTSQIRKIISRMRGGG